MLENAAQERLFKWRLTTNQWRMLPKMPGDFASKMRLQDVTLAQVLFNRGYDTECKIQTFLFGETSTLADCEQLHGLTEAVGQLSAAIRRKRCIGLLVQPDVQGISAAVLLAEALHAAGGFTAFRCPSPVREGPHAIRKALDNLNSCQANPVLVVGNTSLTPEDGEYASQLGLTVISINGHLVCGPSPNASADLSRTHHALSSRRTTIEVYPEEKLSTAAVAYKVGAMLFDRISRSRAVDENLDTKPLLDLVALGTVGDLLAMDCPEARDLVMRGLGVVSHGRRMGLIALARQAGEPAGVLADADTCRRLGARIDALCWNNNAEAAIQLLTTDDWITAERQAMYAEDAYMEREKRIHAGIASLRDRISSVNPIDTALIIEVIDDEDLSLAGAVAAALSSRYCVPAIVLTLWQDMYHGICQGVPECDLYAALSECCDLTDISYEHNLRARISVQPELLDEFRDRVCVAVRDHTLQEAMCSHIQIDAELTSDQITLGLCSRLQLLEPYGFHNRRPTFLTSGLHVVADTCAECEGQLRFQVKTETGEVGAVICDARNLRGELPGRVDIVYHLQTNHKQGRFYPELHVLDLIEADSFIEV